jgi:tetratricopeptide (TPR) repeat protein
MLRSLVLVAFLAPSVNAEEEDRKPEPGPVPTTILRLEELSIPAGKGDAQRALTAFLEAHEAHRKGDLDRALTGYLVFLGLDARVALPARYERTVRERLDGILERIRARYKKALALYEKNRRKGLVELRAIAERYPMLPEGKAALALEQTDAIHFAMADARALAEKGEKKKAAESLEKAVRRSPAALYLYEAKSLLVELGGPDLFEADERMGEEDPEEDKPGEKKEDGDDETVIEMGD